uniref:FGF20 protein n=1 Tax=Homo sapiens TaxID=9606 RepID=Q4V769_HUMAN|nr:FGF20 protein [Homo sapiens]AAH98128.1 FGF20 protein [Homo sapiens]AAH98153.1 FGF20 protein [Homo sapiens]AAH98339.1 FGF20 protein [Homo sapiens]
MAPLAEVGGFLGGLEGLGQQVGSHFLLPPAGERPPAALLPHRLPPADPARRQRAGHPAGPQPLRYLGIHQCGSGTGQY